MYTCTVGRIMKIDKNQFVSALNYCLQALIEAVLGDLWELFNS